MSTHHSTTPVEHFELPSAGEQQKSNHQVLPQHTGQFTTTNRPIDDQLLTIEEHKTCCRANAGNTSMQMRDNFMQMESNFENATFRKLQTTVPSSCISSTLPAQHCSQDFSVSIPLKERLMSKMSLAETKRKLAAMYSAKRRKSDDFSSQQFVNMVFLEEEEKKKMKKSTGAEELQQKQEESNSDFHLGNNKNDRGDSTARNKWDNISTVYAIMRVVGASWSWGELTLGFEYYARHIATQKRDFARFVVGAKRANHFQAQMDRWCRFSFMTYQIMRDPMDVSIKKCGLKKENIVMYDKRPQTMRPGYLLCVDNVTKSVLLVFRGTKCISDIITDLHASSVRFKDGYSHKGMLTAAQWFNQNTALKNMIRKAMQQHPTYKLALCGHSLGGGVAIIVANLWKEQEFPDLECVAFACPSILSRNVAKSCASYITTFINGDDLVPRLSTCSIEELRLDISNYPWKEEMVRELSNTSLARIARGTKTYIQNFANGVMKRIGGIRRAQQQQQQQPVNQSSLPSSSSSPPPQSNSQCYVQGSQAQQLQLQQVVSAPQKNVKLNLENAANDPALQYYATELNGEAGEYGEENTIHTLLQDEKLEHFNEKLYPAGRIFQIRKINPQVHLKRVSRKEYGKIAFSNTMLDDHKMIHYHNNLLLWRTQSVQQQLVDLVGASGTNAEENPSQIDLSSEVTQSSEDSLLEEGDDDDDGVLSFRHEVSDEDTWNPYELVDQMIDEYDLVEEMEQPWEPAEESK